MRDDLESAYGPSQILVRHTPGRVGGQARP